MASLIDYLLQEQEPTTAESYASSQADDIGRFGSDFNDLLSSLVNGAGDLFSSGSSAFATGLGDLGTASFGAPGEYEARVADREINELRRGLRGRGQTQPAKSQSLPERVAESRTGGGEMYGPPTSSGPAARLQAIRDAIGDTSPGNMKPTGMISVGPGDDLSELNKGKGSFSKLKYKPAKTAAVNAKEEAASQKQNATILDRYGDIQKLKLERADKIRKALGSGESMAPKGMKDEELDAWIEEQAGNQAMSTVDPISRLRLQLLMQMFGG